MGCLRGLVTIAAMIVLAMIFAATYRNDAPRSGKTAATETATTTDIYDAVKSYVQSKTWRTFNTKSRADDSDSVFLTLESEFAVPGFMGRNSPAVLTIRCVENTTAVTFNFADAFVTDIEGYGRVRYRIDAKSAQVRDFLASTDNKHLGLWSGGTSIPFVKSILDASSLYVEVTPFNESTISADFPVKGLREAIEPLRKACNW